MRIFWRHRLLIIKPCDAVWLGRHANTTGAILNLSSEGSDNVPYDDAVPLAVLLLLPTIPISLVASLANSSSKDPI
jgi:hypothetical protein